MVIWLWLVAVAGAVQLVLRAEPDELSAGQSGVVRVVVIAGDRTDPTADTRRPPPVPVQRGLQIGYSGQMSQFRSVNGRITQIQQFEYRVTALEPGTWTVGPVELTLSDGSIAAAAPVELVVRARDDARGPDAMVTAEAGLSTDRAWEGQVVLYEYGSRMRVQGARVEWRFPVFDGLRVPQNASPVERSYTIDDPAGPILVEEGAIPLVAVATGRREQAPAIAHVRTPFLFGSRPLSIDPIATQRAAIEILPLPPAPPGFSGLVGDFELISDVSRRTAAVGQSIDWTIRVVGDGALEGFSLPAFEAAGASIYDQDGEVVARVDQRYQAVATFHRVIVPTDEGTLTLPELSVVTFSPTEGRYVTRTVKVPPIRVTPGREGDGTVERFGTNEPTLPDGAPDDRLELRPPYTWGRASAPPLAAALPVLLGLFALPGAAVLGLDGLAAWRRRREARARAETREVRVADLLARLPTETGARLAALDQALRRLEERAPGHERLGELRARLGRVRFGGGPPDPSLEADLRAVAAELDRARAA